MTSPTSAPRQQRPLEWGFYLVVAFVFLVVLPQALSTFQINLLGKFLTYAIVALGLDLIWGYTGMLSLGQGLFFGLGAYCFGMYLNLEAAGGGLPEFMGLYGVFQLPWFWEPFHSPVAAIILAMLVPMVIAAILGFMLFRSRIQGVYFSIITQAFTAIIALLLVGQQQYINGTNGLTEIKTIFGYTLAEPGTQLALYLVTFIVMAIVFLVLRVLVRSRFGRLLVAVRDDEDRVRFVGYNPVILKTIAFVISAGVAGIAGALFVPQVGIISPQQLDIVASIEIVIWVAVGGRGSLVGAILGAILVNGGKSTISSVNPDLWQIIMGALFVIVVLVMPKGIVGSFKSLTSWRRVPQQPAPLDFASEEIESVSAKG
ncbi:MAG: urea ABC transporter permease subunit UrtC [Anaerolineae bacterium]|nr:urea ABC transporter permease subunit UrtC [Anaerolineae bacterium]